MFNFSSLSFRTKLMIGFTFSSICMMVVGGTGFYGLRQTGHTYEHVAQVNLGNSEALAELAIGIREMATSASLVLGRHLTPNEMKEERESFEAAVANYEKGAKLYEAVPFVEGEAEKWEAVKKEWAPYLAVSRKLIALSESGTPADEKLRDELGTTKFPEAKKSLIVNMRALRKFQTEERDKWVAMAESQASHSLTLSMVLVVGGTLFSMIFGFIMSSSLSKSLNHIAEQLSAGATEVAAASGQLSSSSQSLSSAASEQAASLQQTSASLEQVNSMVNKTSDNAGQALNKSGASKTSANQGQGVVQEMLRRMEEINQSNVHIAEQINRSNTEISGIVKVIEEIGSKTKVINDIVFQTKLLSFNASVEAARAGEHGKGFAVVAEEVGNLAQMSGNAAKEISEMLDNSIQGVVNTVNETKAKVENLVSEGRHRVESGITVARQCGDAFGIIVENITSVAGMTEEISTATTEQAQGVQEITKAIRQLDQVTQQNASANEQVAAASEELSSQAKSLKDAAGSLLVLVNGRGAKAA